MPHKGAFKIRISFFPIFWVSKVFVFSYSSGSRPCVWWSKMWNTLVLLESRAVFFTFGVFRKYKIVGNHCQPTTIKTKLEQKKIHFWWNCFSQFLEVICFRFFVLNDASNSVIFYCFYCFKFPFTLEKYVLTE